MQPTTSRLFTSTSSALARAPRRSLTRDALDIATMVSKESAFDYPLTRPTWLKIAKKRDFLHYLRLEQLQFKDLVAFRRPYTPPSPTQIVKLRTQHYQGEPHPASRKVTLTLSCSSLYKTSLNSSKESLHKFKLLAGPRWDSVKDEVKLSCELFPEKEMNEKWCCDTLDRWIQESLDLTDPMTDIPLDERPTLSRIAKSGQHKIVTLKDFPKDWLPKTTSSLSKKERRVERIEETKTKIEELPSAGVGNQGGAKIPGRASVETL